jgi:hypothetical protein
MKPIKVTLKKPITAHGEDVKELTLNEPTLGALDGVDLEISSEGRVKINLGDIAKIVANMADIPPSSAAQISIFDLREIAPAVMDFLGGFLATGES